MSAATFTNITPASFSKLLANSQLDGRKRKRRHRGALSCDVCRRQKIRCNRELPCNQCDAYGRGDGCRYSGSAEDKQSIDVTGGEEVRELKDRVKKLEEAIGVVQSAGHIAAAGAAELRQGVVRSKLGKSRYFGVTHWAAAVHEIPEMQPFFNKGPSFASVRRVFHILKERIRPSARSLTIPSKSILVALLPPRTVSESLIDQFFSSTNRVYPLLHPPTFKREVNRFWETQSDAHPVWICRLLVVVALGSTAEIDDRQMVHSVETYILSSGALQKPCIALLQTLCFIILFKRIESLEIEGTNGVSVLIGITGRVALDMGLQKDPEKWAGMSCARKEIRRRVWAVWRSIEQEYSIERGLPWGAREFGFDTRLPSNLDDEDFDETAEQLLIRPAEYFTNSSYLIALARLTAVIGDLQPLFACSAPLPTSTTAQSNISALESFASSIHPNLRFPPQTSETDDPWRHAQAAHLYIIAQRAILLLNRPSSTAYSTSALSILSTRLHLSFILDTQGRRFIQRLMKADMARAALSLCLSVRIGTRKDDTLLAPVGAVLESWAESQDASPGVVKAYILVNVVLAATRAAVDGKAALPKMIMAADDAIVRVSELVYGQAGVEVPKCGPESPDFGGDEGSVETSAITSSPGSADNGISLDDMEWFDEYFNDFGSNGGEWVM